MEAAWEKESESKKNLRLFGTASFLNDFGSDMVYPIWPMFVTSVMGANVAILGLLDGLGDALVSFSQAASGYASDRLQRRKVFIWTGYLAGAISRVGYAVSTVWPHLLVFRSLDRIGKIRTAPRDAVVADMSTAKDRGRNFGFLRLMDNAGAVCGIVTCLLLFDIGYRNLFLLAAVPSLLGVVLIMRFLREPVPAGARAFKGLSLRSLDKNLKIFIFLNAVYALGAFSYSFLLLYAHEGGVDPSILPLLYLAFTVTAAVFSLPFGRLADRWGRKPVFFMGLVLWAMTCGGFLILKGVWGAVVCLTLFGLHRAANDPAQKALVSELSPEHMRASTLGGLQMVIGLCALPSSFLAGLLWTTAGHGVPLYCSLALTIVAAVLLLFVEEKGRRNLFNGGVENYGSGKE
jgi:MFS family permease